MPINNTAMNAHRPKRNPTTAHRRVARPRRFATMAVSGAREASTASEVASRFAALSCGRISAKPEAYETMVAMVCMVNRAVSSI